MVAKSRNMIVALGICVITVVLMSSRPVKVEASDIKIYTNSEENITESQESESQKPESQEPESQESESQEPESQKPESQKPVVIETTVVNSDNTMTTTVDMAETYDEVYGLYEESISNEFFIYSTVSNGGISSDPVIIDIPANVDFTLEKNGKKAKYTSGAKIKKKGNYVLRLTAVSGDTTYKSTFRFSIRDAAEKKKENTTGSDNSAFMMDIDREITEADTYEPDAYIDDWDTDTYMDEPDTYMEEPIIEASQDSQSSEADNMDESGTDEIPGEENQTTAIANSLSSVAKYTGFTETYDEATGEYVNTLLSGDVFRTNLPNGIITNSEVILNIPDSLDYTIYKDDELYETTSLRFEEAGSYRVVMSSDRLDYVLAYGDNKEVVYAFRIIVEAVSDMHIFNAPAGFTLTEVYYGDKEIFAVNGMQGSYFKLTGDGSYLFKISDAATGVSHSTNVVLDTQAPEFAIGIKNGVANITYNSTDIDRIDLTKDNVVQTEFSTYKITGKGSYQLTVTDKAGNIATASFQLKDSVNSATIWAVIILIAIISGVFVIVRINQKKVIVR